MGALLYRLRKHTCQSVRDWGPAQAVMVVADSKQSLTITGNGDVLEPHDGVIGAAARFTLPDATHSCCRVKSKATTWHGSSRFGNLLNCSVCTPPAIGSGGGYALAAARALIGLPDQTAMGIGATQGLVQG